MTSIVLALALLAAPADRAGTTAAKGAARFSFLANHPGASRTDVIRRAGEPTVAYDTFIEPGTLDPDIAPPLPGEIAAAAARARARGQELVEVEVLEWSLEGDLYGIVVLLDSHVAYAVFPSAPSQSTVEQVESMFGPAAERREIERGAAHHRPGARLLVWPSLGVAFAVDVDGALARKIVWKPSSP